MFILIDFNINNRKFNGVNFFFIVNFELFLMVLKVVEEKNIKIKVGNVLISDEFYSDNSDYYKKWVDFGVLVVEMEIVGLYILVVKYKVKVFFILIILDLLVSLEIISVEEREKIFFEMIELVLEIVIRI